jgi:spore coat protein U-like protein
MLMTATVVASCNVTAKDLAFGNYDPVSGTPLSGSTTVDVTCTNGTGYVVSMDAGLGSGATTSARKMTLGGNTLTYSLYRNAGHTLVWGANSGVDTVAGTGSGALQSIIVYGQTPAAQTAPAGAYSDTVTVTVTY